MKFYFDSVGNSKRKLLLVSEQTSISVSNLNIWKIYDIHFLHTLHSDIVVLFKSRTFFILMCYDDSIYTRVDVYLYISIISGGKHV